MNLKLLRETYAVCRLNINEEIPTWALKGDFFSVTKTEDELSIVCLQDKIDNDVKCEKDWRVLKVEGPLDFSLIGILANISKVLADVKVSIFAISTYDTDYILLKDKDLDVAIEALEKNDYIVKKNE